MAEQLEIALLIRRNGELLPGFPKIRRLTVDEIQSFVYEQANQGAGVFAAVPLDQIATIQALLVIPTQQVTLRLDGQSDTGIVINANGLLLLLDATIDAGAGASNAQLNNVSGSVATIEGLGAGT